MIGIKALLVQELTAKEREDLEGKSESQLKKEVVLAEKAAKRTLNKANDKIRSKIAVEDEEEV